MPPPGVKPERLSHISELSLRGGGQSRILLNKPRRTEIDSRNQCRQRACPVATTPLSGARHCIQSDPPVRSAHMRNCPRTKRSPPGPK
jgi:hypothetical protein